MNNSSIKFKSSIFGLLISYIWNFSIGLLAGLFLILNQNAFDYMSAGSKVNSSWSQALSTSTMPHLLRLVASLHHCFWRYHNHIPTFSLGRWIVLLPSFMNRLWILTFSSEYDFVHLLSCNFKTSSENWFLPSIKMAVRHCSTFPGSPLDCEVIHSIPIQHFRMPPSCASWYSSITWVLYTTKIRDESAWPLV